MKPVLSCLAACLALLAAPAVAQTSCAGHDLIATLPAADRATLEQASAAAPFPEGNHWRAEKAGATIDLIGTFHLYDPRMDAPMDRLRPLIGQADAVYLEATDVEIKALQTAVSSKPDLLFTTGPTLPEQLSEPEWSALGTAMNDRGIPAFLASKFRPWYVSVMLSMPPCAMASMQAGGGGLDHLIGDAARALGKPTRALEPYDTMFRAFDRISPEDQLDMIRTALPLASQSEDLFATMTNSYFRETHREIWEFGRLQTLKTTGTDPAKAEADLALMEDVLINSRNRAWMDVLRGESPGKHLIVAVGAGHLSGDQGLLNLLKQDGWTLTRQEF